MPCAEEPAAEEPAAEVPAPNADGLGSPTSSAETSDDGDTQHSDPCPWASSASGTEAHITSLATRVHSVKYGYSAELNKAQLI